MESVPLTSIHDGNYIFFFDAGNNSPRNPCVHALRVVVYFEIPLGAAPKKSIPTGERVLHREFTFPDLF